MVGEIQYYPVEHGFSQTYVQENDVFEKDLNLLIQRKGSAELKGRDRNPELSG